MSEALAKLHIGCGRHVQPGWVNIDKSPGVLLTRAPSLRNLLLRARILLPEQAADFPRAVVHADVSRRIPMDDDSSEFAYCSHMVEHLSRWQAVAFVRECRRVLRPGGILRLATPDLGGLIRDYAGNASPFLSGQPTRADAFCAEYHAYADVQTNRAQRLIIKMIGGSHHQWLYDSDSLGYLLKEGGFGRVVRLGFREGAVPDLESLETRDRGLFMEAS